MKLLAVVLGAMLLPPASAWCVCEHSDPKPAPRGSCCGANPERENKAPAGHDAGSCECPSMQQTPLAEHQGFIGLHPQDLILLPVVESVALPGQDSSPAPVLAGTGPPSSSSPPLFLLHCSLLR